MASRNEKTTGWTPENTLKRIQQLRRNNPTWRSFGSVRVEYTILTQRWTYDHKSDVSLLLHDDTDHNNGVTQQPPDYVDLQYLCPWGMKDMLTKNYSSATCKTFEIMPRTVRDAFNLEKDTYNKDNINVTVTNSGNMGFRKFNHIYCSVCKRSTLCKVVESNQIHFQNIENPSFSDVMKKWDEMGLSRNLSDLVGCLIPNKVDVICGPNVRRFITHPHLHKNACHRDLTKKPPKAKKLTQFHFKYSNGHADSCSGQDQGSEGKS